MTIKELRKLTKLSQSKFAAKFHIPLKTLQSWEQGIRKPTEYTLYMLEQLILKDNTEEREEHERNRA